MTLEIHAMVSTKLWANEPIVEVKQISLYHGWQPYHHNGGVWRLVIVLEV
jgi:hypothetical protein